MLKKTPLYQQHLEANAQMVDFAGWQMPLHYGSQLNEHSQVREKAGMFDVSHMGIVDIKGNDAQAFLRQLLANDVIKLSRPYQALYTLMLNHDGGVIDDLIVYFINRQHYRLIINAACTDKDLSWIKQYRLTANSDISIEHLHDFSLLAVQGPSAMQLSATALADLYQENIGKLNNFYGCPLKYGMLARTGYTGEAGYEIMLANEQIQKLWQKLIELGVKPCGLAARDSLRIEAGLNLYGQDMDESSLPFTSNLGWTIDWRDAERDFIGRTALLKHKDDVQAKLVGLVLETRGMLRAGQKINCAEEVIGEITSASFSPLMKKAIAFARINSLPNADCSVEVRGKPLAVSFVKLPFVRHGKILYQSISD